MTAGDPAPTQPPVDRTEELVLAMLARRANRPAPEWLAGRIMEAVASSQQARTGRGGRPAVRPGHRGRWAVAGVAAVLLTAAVGLGYLSGGRLGTPAASDGSSGMAAGPSGPLASGVDSPVTPTPATATAPMTGGDPEGDLAADTLAVVTKAGKNLLVRSAPGKGSDSKVYSPTLPSGTRLLILGGPVAADGLEWYRVLTDGKTMRDGVPIRKYGWVARGEAGETWIKPAAPACWRSLNAATLNALSRVDLLTCYHDTALTIRGRWRPLDPGEAGVAPCDWVTGPCNPREEWLLNPFARITFQADDGTDGEVDVAVPPELRARLEAVPQDATMTATIAMDRPEAPSCSVGDPGDNSADSAVDRAVAACQVRFALQDVAWNDGSVTARSIARVRVDSLPIRTAPGSDIRVPGRALRAGDRVLVAEGPRQVEGIDWFAVAWEDNDSLYGWVPATVKSKPTLAVQHTECPSLGDWQAYVELRWWERLACFGDAARHR